MTTASAWHPPSPDEQATEDGLVVVPRPAGSGWLLEHQAGVQGGGVITTLVKCKRVVAGEFFFMLAKDYVVAPDQVCPAEQLVQEIYRRNYERMFTQVHYASVNPVQHGGRTWIQAAMEMVHPARGRLAKMERVCVEGVHVCLVSAEGAQTDVRTFWPDAQRWLDGVRFRSLALADA
jgi:hypothetical protein